VPMTSAIPAPPVIVRPNAEQHCGAVVRLGGVYPRRSALKMRAAPRRRHHDGELPNDQDTAFPKVWTALEVTKTHFRELFDNVVYRYNVYDSANLTQVRQFAYSRARHENASAAARTATPPFR